VPWIRLSDNYIDHPKFAVLSDGSFRLWHEAMAYCRRHQTDGLIPFPVLKSFMYHTKAREKQLASPHQEGAAPLWQLIPATGYKVHDYLEWNLSKEAEQSKQMLNNHRSAFMRDKGLKQELRDRDKDLCRYCAQKVNWADRKGASGATYDHVNPVGPATLDNLVIACRSCNSRKRNRTPEDAGIALLPPPPGRRASEQESRSDLDPITDLTGYGEDTDLDLDLLKKEKRTPEVSTLFNRFWAAYPRKVGRDAAWRAWQKRRPDLETLEAMLGALAWQSRSSDWLKDGGQFIPHPSTWLNQARWHDEPRRSSSVNSTTIAVVNAVEEFLRT
jgi:hypothetical protein